MDRTIALIGAPASIGIRPYDNGLPRKLDQAPAALRELGLVARLGAKDRGDLIPAQYRDFTRLPGRVRNETEVRDYCLAVAGRVGEAVGGGSFVLVLGGDCSIVLGTTLGAKTGVRGPIGLAYVDGHADFASPEESRSGSAASMCLGLAVGRGDTPLSRLGGTTPLVNARDVVLIGRRDQHEPWYGHEALARSGALDLPDDIARGEGYAVAAAAAIERMTSPGLAGFWIHVDVDVLDPEVMPAVDSPEPGGPGIDDLEELLVPLVRHPKALGMELTIYDPALDPDRSCGDRLVTLLERLLATSPSGVGR
jgi:arginase